MCALVLSNIPPTEYSEHVLFPSRGIWTKSGLYLLYRSASSVHLPLIFGDIYVRKLRIRENSLLQRNEDNSQGDCHHLTAMRLSLDMPLLILVDTSNRLIFFLTYTFMLGIQNTFDGFWPPIGDSRFKTPLRGHQNELNIHFLPIFCTGRGVSSVADIIRFFSRYIGMFTKSQFRSTVRHATSSNYRFHSLSYSLIS